LKAVTMVMPSRAQLRRMSATCSENGRETVTIKHVGGVQRSHVAQKKQCHQLES
jgi:hypothetical protein